MTSYYRQLHAYVRPRADYCGFVGWIILSVFALLALGRVMLHLNPALIIALARWPTNHESAVIAAAVVVILMHCLYRVLAFDREAEDITRRAVKALDDGGSADTSNSMMGHRITIEIACVVKVRLGLPVDNAANRQAAWREASAYLREITRPGGAQQDMRITHRPQHLACAVTLVFLPTEADMLCKRISNSLTMKLRTKFVAGDIPDFGDALLAVMQSRPVQALKCGTQSSRPQSDLLIDMESGNSGCATESAQGGPIH